MNPAEPVDRRMAVTMRRQLLHAFGLDRFLLWWGDERPAVRRNGDWPAELTLPWAVIAEELAYAASVLRLDRRQSLLAVVADDAVAAYLALPVDPERDDGDWHLTRVLAVGGMPEPRPGG